MQNQIFDAIIIGAGPAGMTAGIYASRREMRALIIGKELGGQMVWASEIENFPGFAHIKSYELIEKMRSQVAGLGVEMKFEEVMRILPPSADSEYFNVLTSGGDYRSRTVIMAIGLVPRQLKVPGESEFMGKGVSYCANCDGPFYRNKTVAVVGGGNAALDAAEVLSKIADKVYLIHRRDEYRAFETLVEEVKARANIECVEGFAVKEIRGGESVERVVVKNQADGRERTFDINGIFVEIGRRPSTDLVADLVERDEHGQIIVDDHCRTSQPGLFAAGDVTQVPFKQITIACGQATIAALAAYQYLQLKEGKTPLRIVDQGRKKG